MVIDSSLDGIHRSNIENLVREFGTDLETMITELYTKERIKLQEFSTIKNYIHLFVYRYTRQYMKEYMKNEYRNPLDT